MARKKSPKAAAKKPPARVDRTLSAKPPLRAHPRLVHGFLVRLGKRPGGGTAKSKTPLAGETDVKARAERAFDSKHEGPADDATFH